MIQVCSRCGTRWNVRDQQREWCPRCAGSLLPPSGPQPWMWGGHAQGPGTAGQGTHRLPPGYRWIAVRPGAARPRRPRSGALGPTPRYPVIPRWGLVDPATLGQQAETAPPRQGPSPRLLRATFITAFTMLAAAALLHLVRYVLLIVNRTTLLPPFVAGAVTWLGVVASVATIFSVVGLALVLTEWLISRRAAAFGRCHQPDPRPLWALRAGCLVPFVNVFWAPVYAIELAVVEARYHRLRRLIITWWLLFGASTAVSAFATATSFTSDPQGIADNTVNFIVAYLLAMSTVVMAARLLLAFDRSPAEGSAHRWTVVASDAKSEGDTPAAVEPQGQEPAA